MRLAASFSLLMAATLAGCTEEADSGIPDVAGGAAVLGGVDAVGRLTEEIRIDGNSNVLVPTTALAVYPDGTIAISQLQKCGVFFFSPTGEPSGRVGRCGEGPGEFRRVGRLGWLADTLWVHDSWLRRVSLIAPDRRVVRTIATPGIATPPATDAVNLPVFPYVYPQGMTADGSFISMMDPGVIRGRMSIGRVTPGGELEKILMVLPLSESIVWTSQGENASVPFGNRPADAVSPNGRLMAAAMATLEGEYAGTFSLTAVNPAGDTILAMRQPFEGERLPGSVRDSAVEARASAISSPDLAAAVRNAYVPEFYPPISDLVIGMDDSYWVALRSNGSGEPYAVFGDDGRAIGTVTLPSESILGAAQLDRIWVLVPDELDVQSVIRYSVDWN